jgi:hypothetical protein
MRDETNTKDKTMECTKDFGGGVLESLAWLLLDTTGGLFLVRLGWSSSSSLQYRQRSRGVGCLGLERDPRVLRREHSLRVLSTYR